MIDPNLMKNKGSFPKSYVCDDCDHFKTSIIRTIKETILELESQINHVSQGKTNESLGQVSAH